MLLIFVDLLTIDLEWLLMRASRAKVLIDQNYGDGSERVKKDKRQNIVRQLLTKSFIFCRNKNKTLFPLFRSTPKTLFYTERRMKGFCMLYRYLKYLEPCAEHNVFVI